MITSIGAVAVRLCENLDCDECPVVIYNADTRTLEDKAIDHKPCCENLEAWIKKQSIKEEQLG